MRDKSKGGRETIRYKCIIDGEEVVETVYELAVRWKRSSNTIRKKISDCGNPYDIQDIADWYEGKAPEPNKPEPVRPEKLLFYSNRGDKPIYLDEWKRVVLSAQTMSRQEDRPMRGCI